MPKRPALALWQRWFDQTPEPVYVVDEEQRLRYANAAWEAALQTTFADVGGTMLTEAQGAQAPLAFLAAPPLAMAGRAGRGRIPVGAGWRAEYLPLGTRQGKAAAVLVFLTAEMGAEAGQSEGLARRDAWLAWKAQQLAQQRPAALIAQSLPMQRVAAQLQAAAQAKVPVLFRGEAGVGKRWCAELLAAMSGQTWSALDAGVTPADELRMLLLPWLNLSLANEPRKADGMLYVAHVEHASADVQRDLARLLSPRVGAPRLLAGLHCDRPLEDLVPELRYGLTTLVIDVPALRERGDDFLLLVQQLVEELQLEPGNPWAGVDPQAQRELVRYQWPGNVTELKRTLRELRGRSAGVWGQAHELPLGFRVGRDQQSLDPPASAPEPLDAWLAEQERAHVRRALAFTKGHKTRAAELLAIPRARLHRRLEELQIEFDPHE